MKLQISIKWFFPVCLHGGDSFAAILGRCVLKIKLKRKMVSNVARPWHVAGMCKTEIFLTETHARTWLPFYIITSILTVLRNKIQDTLKVLQASLN